jgi:MFS family permease
MTAIRISPLPAPGPLPPALYSAAQVAQEPAGEMQRAGLSGLREVLASAAVRRLWLAGFALGVMRWLEMLAFSLWVFAETGSPLLVTLTAFARMLPLLLLGGFAGALADRLGRGRTLVLALGILALASLGLAAVAAFGRLTVAPVGAFALLSGIVWSFEMPVRRTMLAEAGGIARINATMGLEMTAGQLTRLLGPLMGGALIAASGIAGVLLLGATLYAAAALLVRGQGPAAAPADGRPGAVASLLEGLGYIRGRPLILAVVVVTALFNLWYLPYVALAPVVAATTMRLGPEAIGVVIGAEGIGAVLGALWVATLARPAWLAMAYALGGLAIALAVLLFSLTTSPALGFALLLVGGFGMACFATLQSTLLLVATPPPLRVRVMGAMTVAIGTAPLGFLLAGGLAEAFGERLALALIAAMGAIAMLVCMAIWPELRRRGEVALPASM